jgi:hypothetical protein
MQTAEETVVVVGAGAKVRHIGRLISQCYRMAIGVPIAAAVAQGREQHPSGGGRADA